MASSSRGARAPDSASSQDSGSGAAQRSSGIRAEASANSTGPGNGLEKASSLATSRGGVSRRSWEEGMAVLMGASSLELAASGSLVGGAQRAGRRVMPCLWARACHAVPKGTRSV